MNKLSNKKMVLLLVAISGTAFAWTPHDSTNDWNVASGNASVATNPPPNPTRSLPRRDWTAADWLETPPAAGGVFRPFDSPPLRQEAVFSRSKVFPCGRWRFSTVRKFPPATGDDFRAFESVPLQQEKTFKRSEQPKFCDLTPKQRIYA